MAAYTPTKLYVGQLGTGSATLFTSTGTTIVKEIVLSNITTSSATATIVVSGQTLVPAVNVAANSLTVIDLSLVMANADTITGLASVATAVNAFIAGVVLS